MSTETSTQTITQKDLMQWDYVPLQQAISKCNSNIPSLFTLAVESIKAFVNPGIRELKRDLMDESSRIFQHNNELRSIDAEHHSEWLQQISEEIGTLDERTTRFMDVERDVDLIERRTENIQRLICGPDGPQGTDMKIYDRVADLNSEVDEIKHMLKEMNENIEALRRFCEGGVSVTKSKRKRKREDIE